MRIRHDVFKTRRAVGLSRCLRFRVGLSLALFSSWLCVAFEIFNFDTTEFALQSYWEASFLGLQWATILAIAFCAIDFAGLARIFRT